MVYDNLRLPTRINCLGDPFLDCLGTETCAPSHFDICDETVVRHGQPGLGGHTLIFRSSNSITGATCQWSNADRSYIGRVSGPRPTLVLQVLH